MTQHRTVAYVCIGGPLDGQLLAAPIDRDRYDLQLPSEPVSLAAITGDIRDEDMVVHRFTYRLSVRRDGDRLLPWACPVDMTDDQALTRVISHPDALEAALQAYSRKRK